MTYLLAHHSSNDNTTEYKEFVVNCIEKTDIVEFAKHFDVEEWIVLEIAWALTLELFTRNSNIAFNIVIEKNSTFYKSPFMLDLSKFTLLSEVLNAIALKNEIIYNHYTNVNYQFDVKIAIKEQIILSIKNNHKENLDTMFKRFMQILKNLIKKRDIRLDQVSSLSEMESKLILSDLNNADDKFSEHASIVTLFEQAKNIHFDKNAAIFADVKLSFSELDKNACVIASKLIKNGLRNEDFVCVHLERSIELIVVLLGILKAGGVYVPIATSIPQANKEEIIIDSAAKFIICDDNISIEHLDIRRINYNFAADQEITVEHLPSVISTSLMYAIYTSGSTGIPKAVLLEHRSIVNRLEWMQAKYPIDASDRVLQKTPYSFDVSVWEFFWPLITGAKIVVAKPNGHMDPEYLAEVIQNESITVIHFVPSMLDVFLEYIELTDYAQKLCSLRYVFVSGEQLFSKTIHNFYKLIESASLINLYGPTEAAIDVTYWDCVNNNISQVMIGRPIQNTSLYILDHLRRPVPFNVVGELYISGIGLARGYLNRHELNQKVFLRNTFEKTQNTSRMYKTGDLVLMHNDGNIEYIARTDDQVKINGIRIELGEIDSKIMRLEWIESSISIKVNNPDGGYLCTFVKIKNALQEQANEYKKAIYAYLNLQMPVNMHPSKIVLLDRFPLNKNGKIDRKQLSNFI